MKLYKHRKNTLNRLNKIIFYLFFIALTTVQYAYAQKFIGGALFGMNASQVSGDNLGGYDKVGITGGVTVSRKLTEKSELEMRITYSAKGSRDVPNYEKGKYSAYYLRLKYIEVPVFYRYKFKKIWLMGGISGGYLIRSSIANENGPFPEFSAENRPFNKYEVCTHYGISLPFEDHWEIEFKSSDTFFLLPIRNHASNGKYLFDRGQLNSVLTFSLKYYLK
jgi:hypothetical protein